jgi:ADP-heptose:LPS heptosyltransferase
MTASASSVDTASGPIRCLVIQLARTGDTLQSLMALRAAKQLYPNLEITFIAREKFAHAAKRVPWIHEVVTFPTDALLGPVIAGKKTEKEAVSDLARWTLPLVDRPWDLIVNWTFSDSSSYLAGLLPGRIKLGFTRKKDLSFSSADGWTHFIQAVIQGGLDQNIHLTDIFTTQLLTALQIHFGDPAEAGNAAVTSKSFFSLKLGEREMGIIAEESARKWITVQLGASQESKTWPAERWAKFLQLVMDKHPEYSITLLGGKEDIERERALYKWLDRSRYPQLNSLVGQTDFDLWASVISRAQWLISGDTAAVHLASVLGTRVLNVSVGPVRWAETGPYGNGHYVVASGLPCAGCESRSDDLAAHACRDNVTAEATYAAWSYAASEWAHRRNITIESHFSRLGYTEQLATVDIRRARIRDTDHGGGLVYEQLPQRPLVAGEWTSMAFGHMARAWYCGWVPPVGHEVRRDRIGPQLIKALRELDESTRVLEKICSEATITAVSLKKCAQGMKSDHVMKLQDRDEIQNLARKLVELDELMERVGKTQIPLQAFSKMSKVLMHNLSGDHLADLGQESAECYRQLGGGIAILRDWLKHTLGLARPMAVAAAGGARTEGVSS